ncbi:uncharacterized protein ACR2FA_009874 [Aphomia sociella]
MVFKTKTGVSKPDALRSGTRNQDVVLVTSNVAARRKAADSSALESADDVIDLGAPRRLRHPRPDKSPHATRTACAYTPNPRLGYTQCVCDSIELITEHIYPTGADWLGWLFLNERINKMARQQASLKERRGAALSGSVTEKEVNTEACGGTRSPRPQTHFWSSGAPRAAPRAAPAPPPRRPAVTPPAAAAARAMDARPPCTADDGSDGNDTATAPSEFLAEFLSAIMQRQYAEALKYCRLILQYEPHNATARGFYPLLQHKVNAHKRMEEARAQRGSSSGDSSAASRRHTPAAAAAPHEVMEQEADEADEVRTASESDGEGSDSEGSCASQSSLELDSSPSLSISRRTDHTDSACGSGSGSGSGSGPGSGSGSGWESTGTAGSGSGSGDGSNSGCADDNGNAPPPPPPRRRRAPPVCLQIDDLENDNDDITHYKTDAEADADAETENEAGATASLRRLRAQFACSIK